MKYILVGDMHVKLDNVEESRRLIKWIAAQCVEHKATPIFMGDQYDAMAIIRAEVLEFWVWAYGFINNALSSDEAKISSISLTGNHDLNSDGSASAMSAHEKVTSVAGNQGFLPMENGICAFGYIRDNEKFIAQAKVAFSQGFKTILCHAEVNGAQYDNGFYAPHGIDIDKLPPALFISGHIHKKQLVTSAVSGSEIAYIGTPRHLTRSDIGEKKGIVLWDTAPNIFTVLFTPTIVSEPFTQVTITDDSQIDYDYASAGRCYVDIKGSAEFIKKALKNIPENVKVRTFPDQDRSPIEIKESDGIPSAFRSFADKFFADKVFDEKTKNQVMSLIYSRCDLLKGADV